MIPNIDEPERFDVSASGPTLWLSLPPLGSVRAQPEEKLLREPRGLKRRRSMIWISAFAGRSANPSDEPDQFQGWLA